jgi:CheY-like chemotaxis protein
MDSTANNVAQGRYLLVVDDEPSVRAVVTCFLEMEGFKVTEVGSSAEAIQVLSLVEVDLLITDIQMPVMTGLELARAVRLDRPELPILLMSGSPPALFFNSMEARCFYLEKPFSAAHLVAKVRQALAAVSA